MSHDNQYKESSIVMGRFDYPKKGDKFYNCYTHCEEIAEHDVDEKFLIVTKND